ncbi:hypothetical protein [Metallosphaera hakonensis]|uniref:Uncharacterized protein n=1 Tax=Metallosphaera hakonensis JCM 8857 = DSM 7519 TaxID=1293036 RepID=A0A2U9IVZ7_9CREN|nr:hypothetical protein [Metallosphaera hakonensis]AWS00230.1 hypothetical protein DFR87_11670 [Metallosphaera hakonensis JCM 8857 = DSM 7519]
MKVVKYELEGKIEINGKTTTIKRKYRHLKSAKDYIREITGSEVKWSEDKDKVIAERKGQGVTMTFEIKRTRLVKPKKEKQEKQEKQPPKEEKKEDQKPVENSPAEEKKS